MVRVEDRLASWKQICRFKEREKANVKVSYEVPRWQHRKCTPAGDVEMNSAAGSARKSQITLLVVADVGAKLKRKRWWF